jgi:hypothetical protein
MRAQLEAVRTAAMGVEVEEPGADGKPVRKITRRDFEQAAGLIAKFLAEHPDFDVAPETGKPGDGRRGLEAARGEMLLRLKLLSVARDAAALSADLGEEALQANRKEEAEGHFKAALAAAGRVLGYWPGDRGAAITKAQGLLRTGRVEDAVKLSDDLRRRLETTDLELWFKATRICVDGLIQLAKHEEARSIIRKVWLTGGQENIRKYWPDFDAVVNDLAFIRMKLATTPAAARAALLGQ